MVKGNGNYSPVGSLLKLIVMIDATIAILITALIWGVTDPLMKKFGSLPKHQSWISDLLPFLANWKYALTFGVNQLGSVTFLWTLNQVALSYAVPVTNSLKFLITVITGQILGEAAISRQCLFGILLIFCGISLQLYDKHGGGYVHQ
jgi:drug/metabolite transporter (DMT)-like permease